MTSAGLSSRLALAALGRLAARAALLLGGLGGGLGGRLGVLRLGLLGRLRGRVRLGASGSSA